MRKIAVLLLTLSSSFIYAQSHYLLIGTYDSPESEGIHVFGFDTANGMVRPVSSFKTSNPSYLTVSPDEQHVYTVQETASKEGLGGKLKALAFHKQTGMLSLLNEQHSWGDHPCHVVSDKSGKWIFAANYGGGSLAKFAVLPDGSLGPASVTRMTGSGPHARQKSSHVHGNTIHPGNEWLITTDLGTDSIHVFSFDPATGKLTKTKKGSVRSAPGSGPRLSVFRPDGRTLYVIEELSGTVAVYDFKNGKLKARQSISTMLPGDTSFAGSAHIQVSPDGRFLYASNRGTANSIAIYSIGKKGNLYLLGHQPAGGIAPRNFSIDPSGKFLLVANQLSNEVVVFNRDMQTGSLSQTSHRINLGKPVCLIFIKHQ